MKILITGAGGAAAISVWKSLHEEHELFMADMDPCSSGLYLVDKNCRCIIPAGQAVDYIPTLMQVCIEKGINVLIPTVDAELLKIAKNREEFSLQGIKIALGSLHSLELCYDKYLLLEHCKSTGITPLMQVYDAQFTADVFQFPCFAKPRIGAGSRGVMVIEDLQSLAQLPQNGSYLVQELLSGDEYSVDVYVSSDKHVLAAVPRLRMKIDSGIAVASQTVKNPELIEKALTIISKVDITYVANIQFKANAAGEFKLLEINPRFPGTLPLTGAAGIDIPKLLIQDLSGTLKEITLLPFKELMVVRYWTEQFIAVNEWEALCRS